MRHMIDPLDFSTEEVLALLDLADDMRQFPQKAGHPLLRTQYPYPPFL